MSQGWLELRHHTRPHLVVSREVLHKVQTGAITAKDVAVLVAVGLCYCTDVDTGDIWSEHCIHTVGEVAVLCGLSHRLTSHSIRRLIRQGLLVEEPLPALRPDLLQFGYATRARRVLKVVTSG